METPTGIDPFTADEVEFRAVVMLLTLRHNAVSDADIIAKYCSPDPASETDHDEHLVAKYGCLLAPAAAIKSRLREMVETRFDPTTIH